MSHCLQTLFLLIVFSSAQGQNFIRGYINKNGNRIDGYIRHSVPASKKPLIQFKENKNSSVQDLSPADISGYYLSEPNAEFTSVVTKDTALFAEVIIKGPATYSSLGSLSILTVNGESQLIYFPFNKTPDGVELDLAGTQREQLRIIGAIKDVLKDCLMQDFEKEMHPLKAHKIMNAVTYYNTCKGTAATAKRSHLKMALIAGYQLNKLKFKDERFNYFEGQATPKFGIGFDLIPSRFNQRYNFNFQILYWENKYILDNTSPLAPLEIDLNHTAIEMPVSIKLFTRPGRTGFFVNLGISPSFALNGDSNSNLIDIEKFIMDGFGGIGYELAIPNKHRILFGVRYENTIMSPFTVASSQSNIQFDVGFRF